ncbi:MAG: alpha-galactosidase, partial [Myxococcota bacterium]
MEVRRSQGRLVVETASLVLAVNPDPLSFDVSSRDRSIQLKGARPAVDVRGELLYAGRMLGQDFAPVSGTPQTARIETRARCGNSLELTLTLVVEEQAPGLIVDLRVSNLGRVPVPIRRLLPLRVDRGLGGDVKLPFSFEELLFYRMGYQSWTPAGYAPLKERQRRSRLAFVRRMHESPFTPSPRTGLQVSDFVTTLRSSERPAVTLGFLTHRRFLNHIALMHQRAEVSAIEAAVAAEEHPLVPEGSLEAERLWLGIDPRGTDGLATWAERTGKEMQAPVPAPVGTGWCSWYEFFTGVTAKDVERNVEALAPFGSIETIQIDDGYQAAVGDWLEWDPEFPDGVAPLAARIRSAGFRAGIWLAPFLVSRASRVAQDHPGWLLRSEAGRPIVANINPAWKGSICYALDPTHPEVLDWLARTVATLRRHGFDYLKLDFLYAGALHGRRHEQAQPTAAAYRTAIETIREAAGPDPFLLGCGAPLGPSIGLFEGMRIGPDVAPRWRTRLDTIIGIPAAPSARNAVRNVLSRAPLHQRLWINDPDCVLLRDGQTRLTEDEVRTVAAAAFASGGLILLSDDLAHLSSERQRLLERLLPPLGTP